MDIKKSFFLMTALSLIGKAASAQVILPVSTPRTSLVIEATKGGELKQLYYGARLNEKDLTSLNASGLPGMNAYPVYGMNCQSETALAVKHGDGNRTLQMEVVKVENDTAAHSILTTVFMKDKVYPFYVNVYYKAYQDVDIIETWTEIKHDEKKNVTLTQFASGYLPVRRGNVWLSSLYGSWANEGKVAQEPLQPGMKVIKKQRRST